MRTTIMYSFAVATLALFAIGAPAGPPVSGQNQVSTTLLDFFQPGSQPNGDVSYDEFISSRNCILCHEFQPDQVTMTEVFAPWQGSMMGQSLRDPVFQAALTIANQDAAFAGDLCLRCHSPGGWLSGRSEPTDGSAMIAIDRDGVSCSVCHRMVDPVLTVDSPFPDSAILGAINPIPTIPGGGSFVMDPLDRRRGPFETTHASHMWLESPFFQESRLCATCHDVSNPVFIRNSNGTYSPTPLDAPHPSGNKYDMFPLERTYSEWLHSDFAKTGVDMGGRFGGNKTVVSTCQDCHMPDVSGWAANSSAAPSRDDMPAHILAGGNTWVQDMILDLYPDDHVNAKYLAMGQEAAQAMLQNAATLEVSQEGPRLRVRVINETGHKLPTGYPEGRRMWINVRFLDAVGKLIQEHGHYDDTTAELTRNDTKVYEIKLGLDATMEAVTGIPAGESFHFALNNVVLKDNRIPPRGYLVGTFHEVQANPVGASYIDGQFWDDSVFDIPSGAISVDVGLYYQTASKEFITFLRDENRTDETGNTLYAQWEPTGKSPPVLMNSRSIAIHSYPTGDTNLDGAVDLSDFALWETCMTNPNDVIGPPPCLTLDFEADGDADLLDLRAFLLQFGS